ncbi:MAG: hypothetical protein IT395_00290 [Candidatus Omnitrophica bacterium]|nr:hypothetical protein [Candidatus Omnitrophota bacterium]
MANEQNKAGAGKSKGFFARLIERLDKKMEEKAKNNSCCSSDKSKGGKCC